MTDKKPAGNGMYKQFTTSAEQETAGVTIDYGEFRVRLARAGGANRKFAKVLEAKTKPFRRAIQTETMDETRGTEILHEVYAETIVLSWETKVDDVFKVGIEPHPDVEDRKLLPVNVKNIVATFKLLPDLFDDFKEQANRVALYREEILEDDSGN